ncbi:MAG: hypothetical protein C0393_04445, partial [Anaerolinea sp.]|nr:hypothetical protein [Anaerolinea sp.]
MSEQLVFNGINAVTGEPLLPPMDAETISGIIRGEPKDEKQIKELKFWYERSTQGHYAVKEGADPTKLEETGWGVVFTYNADPAIREALKPLLDWRKEQASKIKEIYYREYTGPEGYRPNESKQDFLARHGAGPGPADPEKVPYYILIVGDPETIPYRFQYQVDVQYAVGRIYFDKVEDHWNYANSVVKAEKEKLSLPRNATFFGVANPDDQATNLSSEQLIKPLVESMSKDQPKWGFNSILKEDATKARLGKVL